MTFQMSIEKCAWALDMLYVLKAHYPLEMRELIIMKTDSQRVEDVLRLVFPKAGIWEDGHTPPTPIAAPATPPMEVGREVVIIEGSADLDGKKVEEAATKVKEKTRVSKPAQRPGRPKIVRKPKPCGHCRTMFTPKRKGQGYCSSRCQKIAAVEKAREARWKEHIAPTPISEPGVSYMPESEQGLVFKALMEESHG